MFDILYLIWILSLSFISGAANVYMMLLFNVKASHHTGNLSNLAVSLVIKGSNSWLLLALIILFFTGSFFAGIVFHQRSFGLKKRYGYVLIGGGVIILILAHIDKSMNLFFIPFLLGIQNGLFIKYKGILIRSSHFTGYLTDSAFYIGSAIRGDSSKLKKAFIYILSIILFVMGGIIMAYTWVKALEINLLLSTLYIVSGLYYFFVRRMDKKRTKI